MVQIKKRCPDACGIPSSERDCHPPTAPPPLPPPPIPQPPPSPPPSPEQPVYLNECTYDNPAYQYYSTQSGWNGCANLNGFYQASLANSFGSTLQGYAQEGRGTFCYVASNFIYYEDETATTRPGTSAYYQNCPETCGKSKCPRCTNDPSFIDANNHTCADHAGKDCSQLPNLNQEEIVDVQLHCPESCSDVTGHCPPSPPPPASPPTPPLSPPSPAPPPPAWLVGVCYDIPTYQYYSSTSGYSGCADLKEFYDKALAGDYNSFAPTLQGYAQQGRGTFCFIAANYIHYTDDTELTRPGTTSYYQNCPETCGQASCPGCVDDGDFTDAAGNCAAHAGQDCSQISGLTSAEILARRIACPVSCSDVTPHCPPPPSPPSDPPSPPSPSPSPSDPPSPPTEEDSSGDSSGDSGSGSGSGSA